MPPITDVRDISRIAYGFMASRALFAALEVDVFGRLAGGPKSLEELARGGRLLVHDFMLDDDRNGPTLAALWLLNALTIDPDIVPLTPAWLSAAAGRAGFDDCQLTPVVPGTTRLLSARR